MAKVLLRRYRRDVRSPILAGGVFRGQVRLTAQQRQTIRQARDCFLIELENLSRQTSIDSLVQGALYSRSGGVESYLFDQRIPTFTDPDVHLKIRARVQAKPGFRPVELDSAGIIHADRKISFSCECSVPHSIDLFKWKVQNDSRSPEPRGEITDHRTRSDSESTKYKGSHYVECFAIKDGTCIAKIKQNVVIK